MATPILGLRSAATPTLGLRDDQEYDADLYAAQTQRGGLYEAMRGWKSSGIQEDVGALTDLALKAEAAGDKVTAQRLGEQARGLAQRAQSWAPTTANVTDVRGPGQAAEWALGALGGLRSTVKPLAAGVAGGLAGAVAAPFTLGIVNPVTGSMAGAGLAGYDLMTNEAQANAFFDPEIRSKRTAQEITDTSRLVGAAGGALEAIVPGGVGAMITAPVKGAVKQAIKSGAKGYIGRGMLREAGEEALTEGAQDLVGQTGSNYLAGREGYDLEQVINAAAAGALPGAAMGGMGRGAQVAKSFAADALDKTADVARNPGQVIGDAIADAGTKAGEIAGNISGRQKAAAFEEALRSQPTITPDMTDEQVNEAVRQDMSAKREAAAAWVETTLNDPDASPAEHDLATEVANRAGAGAANTEELVAAGVGSIAAVRDRMSNLVTKITGEGPAPKRRGNAMDTDEAGRGDSREFRIARLLEISKLKASEAHDALRTLSMPEIDRLDRAVDNFAKGAGDNQTRALFEELFGGAKQFEGVLSMYREAEKQNVTQDTGGIDKSVTNTKFDDEKGVFNEDGEKQNEQRRDVSTAWEASHAKSGSYFDLKDEAQRGRFERAKEGLRNKVKSDNANVNVSTVGMVDREVMKLGDNASAEMIEEKKLEIVNDPKYGFPKLEAPKAPPAGNAVAAADFKKRRAAFETELNRRVRAFNKRFQTLRADAETVDRGAMDFTIEDVRDVQNNTDLKNATKASPTTGTLVLERADAEGPFITSAPKLLGRMFKLGPEKEGVGDTTRPESLMALLSQGLASLIDYSARGKKAVQDFAERQSRGEVTDDESSEKDVVGVIENVTGKQVSWLNSLSKPTNLSVGKARKTLVRNKVTRSDEIAPNAPAVDFTGRIGYVRYGKTQWINDLSELPDEFLIQARGGRITMGDVRNAQALKKAADSGNAERLANQLRKMGNGKGLDHLGDKVKGEIMRATGSYLKEPTTERGDKVTALVRQHFGGVFSAGGDSDLGTGGTRIDAEDARYNRYWANRSTSRGTRQVLGKSNEVSGKVRKPDEKGRNTDNLVPSEVDQTVDDMQVDLTPAETGLLAYGNTGEDATIHRDDRGFQAGDMAGYGTAGPGSVPASKGKSRGEDNQSPATKATPERVGERDDSVDRIEYVAEQVRRGFGGFMQWFKTLNNEQKTAAVSALRLLKDMTLDGLRIAYNKTVDADTHKKLVALAAKLEASIIEGPFARNLSDGPFAVDDEGRHYRESARAKVGARDASPVHAQKVRDGGGVRNAQNDRPVAEAPRGPDAGAVAGGAAPTSLIRYKKGDTLSIELNGGHKADVRVADVFEFAGTQFAIHKSPHNSRLYSVTEVTTGRGVSPDSEGRASTIKGLKAHIIEKLEKIGEPTVRLALTKGQKANAQSTSAQSAGPNPTDVGQTSRDFKAAVAEVKRMLGDDFPFRAVKEILGPNGEKWSGDHVPGLIRVAFGALDKVGVARHEAMHEFFSWLNANGADSVRALIENASKNPLVRKRLEYLLADHKNSLDQLNDPEEASAYLFQFWLAGQVKLGPKHETLFQKIVAAIDKLQLLIREKVFGSETARAKRTESKQLELAEKIMAGFASGALAKADARNEVLAALNENAKALETRAAVQNAFAKQFHGLLKKGLYTAASNFEDSNNPVLQRMGRELFRLEGDERSGEQNFLEGAAQQNDKRQTQIRNIFMGLDKDTMELVGKYLRERVDVDTIHHAGAKEGVRKVRAFLKDMQLYLKGAGTQRWNAEEKRWENMGEVKENYWPRVWNAETLLAKSNQFLELMTADLEQQRTKGAFPEITEFRADVMARAILSRLVNGHGAEEIQEEGLTENDVTVGINPYMAAVNRRELTWLDDARYADFMSKDPVHVLTNYAAQATKRGEYVRRFGNGGTRLRDDIQRALVFEMGGERLLRDLDRGMNEARDEYKKRYRQAKENGTELPAEPTFLGVARTMLRDAGKTAEEVDVLHLEAAKKMEPVIDAIRAMEGTLGHEIDPRTRQILSGVTTYQNFRLLPLALFASFNDIMGIVARGGELSDAWNALVRGVREIRKHWTNEFSQDDLAKLAERLGVVNAGNYLDAMGQVYSSQFMYGKLRRWNDALFKYNGLEAWNRAMRIQATGSAVEFIKRHLTKPNEHSTRYMDELFGKGWKKEDLLTAEGELNYQNAAIEQGVLAWVNGAVLRPNAAQRPVYASDPHYQLFYHLKQFAYSFHKVILRRSWVEAKHGNFNPLVVLFAGYIPVSIAADAVKETLLPDDDPAWMKMGLGSYIQHGAARANLGGVPQMLLGDAVSDPTAVFGPSVDEVADFIKVPLFEDKTLMREFLGALPGGVIARRATD